MWDVSLKLADLVAAKCQARVAVLALGEDVDLSAESGGYPRQSLDGGGAEEEALCFFFF